jgi:outer membrane protein assembly factor BamE
MSALSSPLSTALSTFGSRRAAWVLALATTSLLGACANPFSRKSLDEFSLTYKINIQQGIVVTQEMADQLKIGMTRDQVRFVLGTPILIDPFHAGRWEYPFRFQPGRGPIEERRFTVFFESDKLTGFNGDSLPTEEEFAASRHFATTRIVRAPPLGRPLPPLPGTQSEIGNTSVTPGANVTPDRPAKGAVDQTPTTPATGNN